MSTSHRTPSADPVASRFDTTAPNNSLTIPQFVRRNSQKTGEQTAFRTATPQGWRSWTWREVDTMMSEIAAGLLVVGLDDPIPGYVIGSNEPDFFIAEYALQAVGAIAFPLFEQMTAGEMTDTLAGYGAKVAFSGTAATTRELLTAAEELGLRSIVQWGEDDLPDDDRVMGIAELRARGRELLEQSPNELDRRISATDLDDVACIILTSGTTGKSKGVLGTHRYMLDIAARYAHAYTAQSFDNYLSYLPAAFSVEQYCGMTLAAALPLNVACAESPATVERDFVSSGAQFRFLGPRQWEELRATLPTDLLADPESLRAQSDEIRTKLGLQNVKSGISAGGSLSAEVFEFFRLIGVEIRSVYGFAEVGIITGTEGGQDLDSVGVPLPSPYGEAPIEVRADDNGEILVRGGVRCAGYWGTTHRLSLTDDGWLRSGDAGTWDGRVLRVIDRIDNIRLLPDGTPFAPQPLEVSISQSPFISNVLLVPGHGEDPRIGALVEINEQAVRERFFSAGTAPSGYAELVQDPRVVELVAAEVAAVNSSQPQKISLVSVMPKRLSPDDGELTRSMKLRRAEVLRRYDQLINAMYGSSEETVSFELYVGRDGGGALHSYRSRVATIG